MAAPGKLESLRTMLEPAAIAAGMELWGIEFLPQGKHSVLRLYIDAEQGVGVDDCEAVSHQASAILDVEDPISGEYHLEVSSPGMDRPLFTFDQCARYVGEDIKVRLKVAQNGKRNFTGKLLEALEGNYTFEIDGERLVVAMSQIDKANLVPKFD